jgi:hypothetical protein
MPTRNERETFPTVREYAEQHNLPQWRVRDAIACGDLQTDGRKWPMRITGGRIVPDGEEHLRELEKNGQLNWLEDFDHAD